MSGFATETRTMNVLVAGGAGFVGAHLVRALRSLNHRVVVLDNQSTGSFKGLAPISATVELVDGDVTEPMDIVGLGRFDVIVHLASPASPLDYQRLPFETFKANTIGTTNLLNHALLGGSRFVFASTSEIYGDPTEHPQPESYRGNVDPTGPRAMYDESKRAGETLVSMFRRTHGVNAAIVRIFNAYGPGMRDDGRMIPSFVRAALAGQDLVVHGDGLQTRCPTYITDLISALMLVIADKQLDGLIANIGSTEEHTVQNIAEIVQSITGGTGSIVYGVERPDDPRMRRPGGSVMYDRYRWEPSVGLVQGLRSTVDSMRVVGRASA